MNEDKEQCGNCRFAGRYPQPDPLPVPAEHSTLWGLIKWTDDPSGWHLSTHALLVRAANSYVPCLRYPEPTRKSKTSTCGEYKPKEQDT